MNISFFVPGPPKGKGRPRFDPKRGRARTPDNTRAYEDEIRWAAQDAMAGAAPFTGPVSVSVDCVFLVKAPAKDGAPVTVKPDIDNILKLVLDGMNGVVFADDKQVFAVSAGRIGKLDSKAEGIRVTVQWAA